MLGLCQPVIDVVLGAGVFEGVRPNELYRKWNLVADGDIQPFSSPPYEITFFERTVPETDWWTDLQPEIAGTDQL